MSSRAKPYSSFSVVLIVSLIYFLRKQQGSSAYLIEIGGSSYSVHRDVWLLDCISRDDTTGTSYLYGMGYVTCILYVKRKFRLIICLTWVDLFPLFPKPT